MKYQYGYHDGVVLRRPEGAMMTEVQMFVSGEWKDMEGESVKSWAESTRLTEEEARKRISD